MTIQFEDNATIGDLYHPAMVITDQAEAHEYLEALVQHCMRLSGVSREEAERIQRANLGYFSGYYDYETMLRVEELYGAVHPVFGSVQAGPPSLEEAFEAGRNLANLPPVRRTD